MTQRLLDVGPYKSALIAALRLLLRPGRRNRNGYCGTPLLWRPFLLRRSIQAKFVSDRHNRKAAINKLKKIFLYCAFSIAAAAAAGRSGCQSMPNWVPKQLFCAATEASLYDPKIRLAFEASLKL